MKAVFIIQTLGHGGAERVLSILANGLSKKYDVSIICLEEGAADYQVDENVKVYLSNAPTARGSKIKAIISFAKNFLSMVRRTESLLETIKPDVVISFLNKPDLVAYLCRKTSMFKWIASERNDPWVRNKFEKRLLQHIYKRTDCLVCQTEAVSRYYKSIGVKNTTVIHNPIANSYLHKDERLEIRKRYGRYAVAVGKLYGQKNFLLLVNAVNTAKESIPNDINFIILGDGPQRQSLEERVHRYGLEDRILFIGRRENVVDYYDAAEFFIMTSDYEGTPNALIEAMRSGLPVICTNFKTGSARELVSEKNGYLVQVGNINELAEAIAQMANADEVTRKAMGSRSQEVISRYNAADPVELWDSLIIDLFRRDEKNP